MGLSSASIVRNPSLTDVDVPVDWSTWYLRDEDDMGETPIHFGIMVTLLSSLGVLAKERGWANAYWSGNAFFAWLRHEPLVRVSPDVYLLDDPPDPLPTMWQTWLDGHKPPRFAVEIVSDDWRKDYQDAPLKYAQLGARELVIFDPRAAASASRRSKRTPLQVYRRGPSGAFARVYKGEGPAPSEEIGAFLVVKHDGAAPRLRIARDPAGVDLVPTAEELAQAEAEARKLAEAEKQAADARASAADARASAAEARLRALEAEVARLRGERV